MLLIFGSFFGSDYRASDLLSENKIMNKDSLENKNLE